MRGPIHGSCISSALQISKADCACSEVASFGLAREDISRKSPYLEHRAHGITERWSITLRDPRQPVPVFSDSIANNICMWIGDPLQDQGLQERIRIAASKAQIDQFVESLPEGYQTKVGDRGIRLSGGQRQRLCIARELFREPQLLILDEATSALDSESEHLIQQSIKDLQGRISVLIVAHRLSTIRDVDQIYVIESGRLVEHGSYQALLDTDGSRFSQLVARQWL